MRLARRATRDATHGTRHGRHYNTPYPGRAIRELASSISRDGKQSCKVHRNSLFLHAPCTRAMDATNRRVGGVSPPPPPRAGPRWPTTARPPAHRRARDIDGTENRGPAAGARASSELCAAAGTDRHRGRARLCDLRASGSASGRSLPRAWRDITHGRDLPKCFCRAAHTAVSHHILHEYSEYT